MQGQITTNAAVAQRVREIRLDVYGESGARLLAEEMKLPVRTWVNYESGVVIPAPVILRFLQVTGASASWLLRGEGDRYTTTHRTMPRNG